MPPSSPPDTRQVLLKKNQSSHLFVEWMAPDAAHVHGVEGVLADRKTRYQHVQIFQTGRFGKILVLDGDPQSSEHDEDIYHEALVHPALITHPQPKTVLILGGGEGATLREALRHPSVQKAVMVDIDEEVVNLCRRELPGYSKGAFEDPRAELVIGDAGKYLENPPRKFDAVISDLTLPYPDTPAEGLAAGSFFRLIKSALLPGGIFSMQASRAERGMNSLFVHNRGVLKKIWKTVRPYHAFIPFFYSDWGYIAASDRLDPLGISGETVDRKLRSLSCRLSFYDGPMHSAMFVLPPELRRC